MNRVEYKFISGVKEKKVEEMVNGLAAEGWRLLSVDERILGGTSMGMHNLLLERQTSP